MADALGASGARRSLLTNGAADEPQATANGNVAELQQMIREGKVKELRTTYNGSYGASMLFYPDEMTFYIALFQQKKFWRVIKTQADACAETVYADFAKNSAILQIQTASGAQVYRVECHGLFEGVAACVKQAQKICGDKPAYKLETMERLRSPSDDATDPRVLTFAS